MTNKKRNKWTTDEINFLIENYSKGIEYVKDFLTNHTKLSIKKKAKSLNLKVIFLATNDIIKAVEESYNLSEVFRKLNKSKSGDSYKIIKRIIKENSIDISHFDPYRNNKFSSYNEIPIEDRLMSGTNITSNELKKKLYKYGLKDRICEQCDQGEDWRGKKMALILDHINGISNDNRLENLRILCPNCNATLETHCKGYKNTKTRQNGEKIETLCENLDKGVLKIEKTEQEKQDNFGFSILERESQIKQRKAERPSYDILTDEINKLGYSGTGKKYKVSDNTIKKWKKMYEKYGDNF
jgi:hypothetical protein